MLYRSPKAAYCGPGRLRRLSTARRAVKYISICNIYICIYTYMVYTYIYIYVYREREMYIRAYIYIYI